MKNKVKKTEFKQSLKLTFILLALVSFFIMLAGTGYSWSEDSSLTQNVDDCGILSTTNAVYTLINSVNSTSTCFNITANNITLDCQNFNINYSRAGSLGYGVNITGHNFTTIKNCKITEGHTSGGWSHAINLASSHNSTIENNSILILGDGGYSQGIFLSSSNSNNLTSNTIRTGSYYGYGISATSSNYNQFYSSNITTSGGRASGILLSLSNSTTIANSWVYCGSADLARSIFLSTSSNAIINNNTLSTVTFEAILVYSGSQYNTISNNTLLKSIIVMTGINPGQKILNNFMNITTGSTIAFDLEDNSNFSVISGNTVQHAYYGIFNRYTSDVNITNNQVINAGGTAGIGILYGTKRIIDNNTIIGQTAAGISVSTGADNNLITNNKINQSSGYGISVSDADNNNFTYNYVYNTTNYGLYIFGTALNNTFSNMYIISTYSNPIFRVSNNPTFTMFDSIVENINQGKTELGNYATGGEFNLTNVTRKDGVTPLNITYAASGGIINTFWYLEIYNNYTNSSIVNGANISSYDNRNNLLSSQLSNSSGNIPKQTLQEYIRNTSGIFYKTNYTINGSLPWTSGYIETALVNLTTNKFLTLTFDSENPNGTLLTPANNTITNSTSINFTANISDSLSGLKNATLNIINSSEDIVNQTTTTFTDTVNTVVETVVTLVEGVYKWFYSIFDFSGNQYQTGNSTLIIDLNLPIIQFVSPTPKNNTGQQDSFILNATIIESNLANITYNWNNTPYYYNTTNSSLAQINSSLWILTINQSDLIANTAYLYSLRVYDLAGNINSTETRLIRGNIAPTFNSVAYDPNSLDGVDPGKEITVLANITDVDDNFDSAILQWKNSSGLFGINNLTMNNLTSIDRSFIMNSSFLLPSYQDNFTFRIIANDTAGQIKHSSNYSITSYWDCTWTYDTDLSSVAGWDQIKEVGNITINNTGDIQFANNNCSLDFRLTYDLAEGRIYFDNSYYKPSTIIPLAPGNNRTILVNASFFTEIKQENLNITLNEASSRSNQSSLNVSAVLVTNQQGPYLYEKITNYPNSVYLTSSEFNIKGYIRNLMGSATINIDNTAYNVSFYLVLPSGITNDSGQYSLNYTNITDNTLNYLNTNLTFSDLASMSSGIQTFTLRASGVNLTSQAIKDASGNSHLEVSINITFLCYNISDSVLVDSCGSLDGDYVTPTTTITTTTSQSGGGGGGGKTAEVSEAVYEIVRGTTKKFQLEIKNVYNHPIKKVKIKASGLDKEYLQFYPDLIEVIEAKSSKNLTLTITAPDYFTEKRYSLYFDLEGILESNTSTNSYIQKKIVSLYVLDFSREEADKLLKTAEKEVQDMNYSGMYAGEVYELFYSALDYYDLLEFVSMRADCNQLDLIYQSAMSSKEIIGLLEEGITKAKKNGIKVDETERLLYLGQTAFNRGDFILSLTRLKEARLSFALETKGEFRILYYIKNHPIQFLLILLVITITGTGSSLLVRLQLYRRKLRLLDEEEHLIIGLMKVIQKECFEEGKMAMEEYEEAMIQYESRLNTIIQQKINTETKRAYLFKIKGKNQALVTEKTRLVELMKKVQEDYLVKAKLETRIYENMLKSYASRLSEVEEELALVEAEKGLKYGLALEKGSLITGIKKLFFSKKTKTIQKSLEKDSEKTLKEIEKKILKKNKKSISNLKLKFNDWRLEKIQRKTKKK